jgi:hypothetical protein
MSVPYARRDTKERFGAVDVVAIAAAGAGIGGGTSRG